MGILSKIRQSAASALLPIAVFLAPLLLDANDRILPQITLEGLHNEGEWFEAARQIWEASLRQQLNWGKYHRGELAFPPGSKPPRIYWIQQGQIKQLNEDIWNLGGTERFLLVQDTQIDKLMQKDPTLGYFIEGNYKDRVIVSVLEPEEFKTKVMERLLKNVARSMEELANEVRKTYPNEVIPNIDWGKWLADSMEYSSGKNMIEAHINLKLAQISRIPGPLSKIKNLEDWKLATGEVRQALRRRFTSDSQWEQFLVACRKPDELLYPFLREHGFLTVEAAEITANAEQYRKLLSLADFLPLPPVTSAKDASKLQPLFEHILDQRPLTQIEIELLKNERPQLTWSARRAIFLSETGDAGYIIATDIRNVGSKGLLAQDRWFVRGAAPEELPEIYREIDNELRSKYRKIRTDLLELLQRTRGPESPEPFVGRYLSGDDGLFVLPKHMTEEQLEAVTQYLLKHEADLYSSLHKIEGQGSQAIAKAISTARDSLFNSEKKKYKLPISKKEFILRLPAAAPDYSEFCGGRFKDVLHRMQSKPGMMPPER